MSVVVISVVEKTGMLSWCERDTLQNYVSSGGAMRLCILGGMTSRPSSTNLLQTGSSKHDRPSEIRQEQRA